VAAKYDLEMSLHAVRGIVSGMATGSNFVFLLMLKKSHEWQLGWGGEVMPSLWK